MKLGVNVDHVATIRQARGICYPDPVDAALLCESAGANSIVAHLREDRRHINDDDVKRIKDSIKINFNLEMSITPEIVAIALDLKPYQVTLVPEKRQELTTEGGLDLNREFAAVKKVVESMKAKGICTSLFIDPDEGQIDKAVETGAEYIEIHTGEYANAVEPGQVEKELKRIEAAVRHSKKAGLGVNAGHGLNLENAGRISAMKEIEELNIGHSIIARAVFVGLDRAVKEMLELINKDTN